MKTKEKKFTIPNAEIIEFVMDDIITVSVNEGLIPGKKTFNFIEEEEEQ